MAEVLAWYVVVSIISLFITAVNVLFYGSIYEAFKPKDQKDDL